MLADIYRTAGSARHGAARRYIMPRTCYRWRSEPRRRPPQELSRRHRERCRRRVQAVCRSRLPRRRSRTLSRRGTNRRFTGNNFGQYVKRRWRSPSLSKAVSRQIFSGGFDVLENRPKKSPKSHKQAIWSSKGTIAAHRIVLGSSRSAHESQIWRWPCKPLILKGFKRSEISL